MGHEFSGTVIGLGAGVAGLREGDPVVIQECDRLRRVRVVRRWFADRCKKPRITIGVHADGVRRIHYHLCGKCISSPPGVSLENVALLQPFAIAASCARNRRCAPGRSHRRVGCRRDRVSIIQQALLVNVEFAVGRDRDRVHGVGELGARTYSAYDCDPASVLPERLENANSMRFWSAAAIRRHGTLIAEETRHVVLVGNIRSFMAICLQQIMDQISILTVRTYSLNAWRRALALIPKVQAYRSGLPVEPVPLTEEGEAFERAAAGEVRSCALNDDDDLH